MPNTKGFTRQQIIEAIDNSDYTYNSVATYLAVVFSKSGKCTHDTAKSYIQKYNLEEYLNFKTTEISKDCIQIIRKAIKKGDIKTAKWWLERVLRDKFGNEVVVHNDNKDPLNINLSGDFLTADKLQESPTVEINK